MNAIDPRFDKTIYLVEATHFESLSLWQETAHNSGWEYKYDTRRRVVWEQENPGFWIVIGHSPDNMPLNLSFNWNTLNGKWVCFWEATSQFVDHRMIDAWIEKNLPGIPRTTPFNFSHVLAKVYE